MMLISLNNYSNNIYSNKPKKQLTFERRGEPLKLRYIVEKRAKLIPERVLLRAQEILAKSTQKLPTLLEIHKEIYRPLLTMTSLEEVKKEFPEFIDMQKDVNFERNSRFASEFKERTDENFALKMLQEFWGNLKTKEEIAQDFGMTSRTSLEWPLKQIKFVSYPSNYKTLLRASDPEGNKLIAGKTTAFHKLHPEQKAKLNQMGADAWKNNEELKRAHSERMYELDKVYPERREKIAAHSKAMWEEVPEIRIAMSEFISKEPISVRRIFSKKIKGYPLRSAERRIIKGVYDRFWEANEHFKRMLSEASKKVSRAKKTK